MTLLNDTLIIFSKYYPDFFEGVIITLYISIIGTIIGASIGLGVGIIRTIPLPKEKNLSFFLIKLINILLNCYVEFFRATPMIVQAMVFYYGLAEFTGIQLNKMFAAYIIVSINTGAYMSEIVRGGIVSIDKGQFEAAKALGMNHFKTMKNIIIPQVIRNILPATGNEFIINIKDTSVLMVISVAELFYKTKSIAGTTFKVFPTFLITCVIYLILTITITTILRTIEKKMDGQKNYKLITDDMNGNQMQLIKSTDIKQ